MRTTLLGRSRGTAPSRRRRSIGGLAALSVSALLLVSGGSAPALADGPIARRDASTGWITDLSPVQVAAGVALTGQTTVFARGADGAIWYRTEDSGGVWNGWAAIPGTGMTSGPSVVHSSQGFYVYARGADGSLMETMSDLDSDGRPTTWVTAFYPTSSIPWNSIGGRLTSAPNAASSSTVSRTVVVRGADGNTWQRTYDGWLNQWDAWAPLGGTSYSAPVPVDQNTGVHRYLVNVVGTDGRLWQTSTTTSSGANRDQQPWTGGSVPSSHGLGSANRGNRVLLTTAGADHSVVLRNLTSGAVIPLGGRVTSTAAISVLPSGSDSDKVRVFAQGADYALWYIDYDLGTGAASGWKSLGGRIY